MRMFFKIFLEFLPLGLFFVFTTTHDVYVGTAVMMVFTAISTALVWKIYRKLAWMALISAGTSLIAGVLTLYLVDPLFVKLKPTIVSLIFGAILLGGLAAKRAFLKPLLGEDLNISEEGWRIITMRWGLYFVAIAVLNEVVWRGADIIWGGPLGDEIWAAFKAMVLMPLTIVYAMMQLPLLKKHRACENSESLADISLFPSFASSSAIIAEPQKAADPAADRAPRERSTVVVQDTMP